MHIFEDLEFSECTIKIRVHRGEDRRQTKRFIVGASGQENCPKLWCPNEVLKLQPAPTKPPNNWTNSTTNQANHETTKQNSKTWKKQITSLRVIPTVTLYWNIFVTNSDILSALRSLDFIRIILSSSSLLLVRGPAVTTVIYQAKLIQTDSRYAWFKTISDARASPDA